MSRLRAAFVRFDGLFGKARHDRQLAEELESHLQMHIDDNLRAGMSPADARRRALVKLGGVEAVKEHYRDRRGIPALETLLQDVRYAVPVQCKTSGFAVVTILTLALGIGPNTAIFSVLHAVLLKGLPVEEPHRLVTLGHVNDQEARAPSTRFSYAMLEVLRPHTDVVVQDVDNCTHFRVHEKMSRWKRFGVIVVRYATDHDPSHVHVFEDGKRLLKFDIDSWRVMEGRLTPRARKALDALREEGVFGEKSEA